MDTYKSLVTRFSYCVGVFDTAAGKKLIHMLDVLQRKALQAVFKLPKRYSTTYWFVLKSLSLNYVNTVECTIIQFAILCIKELCHHAYSLCLSL